MHIAFLSHLDLNLYRFRRQLIQHLIERGWKVTVIVPCGPYVEGLKRLGASHVEYSLNRRGINPFQELMVIFRLISIFRKLRPDILHTFTVKPNLYGTVAARLAGVRHVVSSVTGLGSYFTDDSSFSMVRAVILNMYRLVGRLAQKVIFQNKDDLLFFKQQKIIPASKTELIRGSGVDLEEYSPNRVLAEARAQFVKHYGLKDNSIIITMIARLIWDKGVGEFCTAAQKLKKKYGSMVSFLLVGDYYEDNPRTVPKNFIEKYADQGIITFTGWQEDIPLFLAVSDIVVLPSYREGLPVSLQEALAMAKPIVTCDVPGCREVVDDGVNGYLVPVKDGQALANAVENLILDPCLREVMGQKSRLKAEKEFNVYKIVEQHINLYAQLLGI